jgi:hypothetical protein
LCGFTPTVGLMVALLENNLGYAIAGHSSSEERNNQRRIATVVVGAVATTHVALCYVFLGTE